MLGIILDDCVWVLIWTILIHNFEKYFHETIDIYPYLENSRKNYTKTKLGGKIKKTDFEV